MNKVQIGLIVLALVALGYVVYLYNQRYSSSPAQEGFQNQADREREVLEHFNGGEAEVEQEPEQQQVPQQQEQQAPPQQQEQQAPPQQQMGGAPGPSESNGNETYSSVANFNESADPTGLQNNQLPNDCYPKDQLAPQELLPQDANSTWAQVVPAGQGDIGGQNFLNAGQHVGANSVGQTLRNPNLQLRSEPANPQSKVSPWGQSTMGPDTSRRSMEIGN
jgi:hypothetical protein